MARWKMHKEGQALSEHQLLRHSECQRHTSWGLFHCHPWQHLGSHVTQAGVSLRKVKKMTLFLHQAQAVIGSPATRESKYLWKGRWFGLDPSLKQLIHQFPAQECSNAKLSMHVDFAPIMRTMSWKALTAESRNVNQFTTLTAWKLPRKHSFVRISGQLISSFPLQHFL